VLLQVCRRVVSVIAENGGPAEVDGELVARVLCFLSFETRTITTVSFFEARAAHHAADSYRCAALVWVADVGVTNIGIAVAAPHDFFRRPLPASMASPLATACGSGRRIMCRNSSSATQFIASSGKNVGSSLR